MPPFRYSHNIFHPEKATTIPNGSYKQANTTYFHPYPNISTMPVPPQLHFGYPARISAPPQQQQQMVHNRRFPSTKRTPFVHPSTIKPIELSTQDSFGTRNRKLNHVNDHESNNGSDNDSSGDETQVELSNIAYKMRNDTLFSECKLICPDNIRPEKASVQRHIFGPDTGKSKGFAYITFSSHDDAKEALEFFTIKL